MIGQRGIKIIRLAIVCLMVLLVCGCAEKQFRFLSESESKTLAIDDMGKSSFLMGLDKSLDYWRRQAGSRTISLCGKEHSSSEVVESLQLFRDVYVMSSATERESNIRKKFDLCYQGNGEVLVTGYYQPILKGSFERRFPYLYPLYKMPGNLVKQKEIGPDGSEKEIIGRKVDGELLPYWSRAEIENENLLEGEEIVYLDDPVKAFILHVQGSGMIQFPDGSERAILYAGTNGRPYRSIGKLLADEGRIPLEEIDMPKIKKYLNEHLDEQKRILQYNERFVFFRWGDTDKNLGVFGSMGRELTPGRSVALDQSRYPVGMPAYLESSQPVFNGGRLTQWKPLRRFVLNQDSGAAIKGKGRVDLFVGRGRYAESAAGVMKQDGKLFFFVKKGAALQKDVSL